MLHVVFYASIASEKGAFDIGDVLEGINKKLIYRHPHVCARLPITHNSSHPADLNKMPLIILYACCDTVLPNDAK